MLSGRVAVITGAGRGIGAAAAKLFCQQGAKVIVNDIDAAVCEETVQSILDSKNGHATPCVGSVTAPEFPEYLVETTQQAYGGNQQCDILVNNAGFLWDGVIHKMTDQQWQSVLDCHATAPFRIIRAFAPLMRDAGKNEVENSLPLRDRCILNVSSTSGLHGNVGQANYALAKAGICGLTKTVAKEWGPWGVRCNAIAFGMMDTRMTSAMTDDSIPSVNDDDIQIPAQGLPPQVAQLWQSPEMLRQVVPLARMGRPEEAAQAMLFLASPMASYITGHTLEVTGGMGI